MCYHKAKDDLRRRGEQYEYLRFVEPSRSKARDFSVKWDQLDRQKKEKQKEWRGNDESSFPFAVIRSRGPTSRFTWALY